MNVHSPVTPVSVSVSDAIDRLDELHALLEATHMMASALEMNQANALQRVVVLGQRMIDDIKEGLLPPC